MEMTQQLLDLLKSDDYRNILIGIRLARVEGFSDIEIFDELNGLRGSSYYNYQIDAQVKIEGYIFYIFNDYKENNDEFCIHYYSRNTETSEIIHVKNIPDSDQELYQQTFNEFKQLFIEHLIEGKYFNL